jgi:hypothetical protein
MNNVQNCDSYINIIWTQTGRTYLLRFLLNFWWFALFETLNINWLFHKIFMQHSFRSSRCKLAKTRRNCTCFEVSYSPCYHFSRLYMVQCEVAENTNTCWADDDELQSSCYLLFLNVTLEGRFMQCLLSRGTITGNRADWCERTVVRLQDKLHASYHCHCAYFIKHTIMETYGGAEV